MAAKKAEVVEKQMTIEEAFLQIDEKIRALEAEDISLEESFNRYREGMELLKFCHDSVAEVEKKVQAIAEDGTLEDFE